MPGLVVGSIALLLFSSITPETSYAILSVYMILLGIGTGLFLAPNLRGVMSSVPKQRRGIGSAMVTLFLNIGLAVSLNLAILVMSLTSPYDLITRIISSVNPVSITPADRLLFFESLKNTYLVTAIVNALAIPASLLQIRRTSMRKKSESPIVSVSE